MPSTPLALRALFRTPFVTLVAVVSLALGIGANTAIFSLFNEILLRPLPVREPGGLVNLGAPGPKPGSQSCNQAGSCEDVFSYPMFKDLQKVQAVFTGIAAHRAFGANLSFRGQTLAGEGMMVSGTYFPVLGLQPAVGRLLSPEDDQAPGEAPVVVLSHDYWRKRFDADPAVVGDRLIVNGQSLTIVGVAPAGFRGTTVGAAPQVFVPITLRGQMNPGFKGFDNRQSYWAYLFARLRPGMEIDRARAGLNGPYKAILLDVEAPLQKGMTAQTMARFTAKAITVEDGRRGQSGAHRELRPPMILLLSVTGIVLLIACANIANLLLARGAARGGEMAIRLSIGAGRRHLVAQLLKEALVLAALGGIAGVVVAYWTIALIVRALPAEVVEAVPLHLDGMGLLFAALLSLGTGILFGLFPALQTTRADLASTLKGQAGQPAGSRSAARFRKALATAQVALSMALLVAAGLFIRSLTNISRIDLGIDTESVLAFSISPELNGYTPERSKGLFERLEDELAAVPGVASVSAAMVPLLSGSNWGSDVRIEGYEAPPDEGANTRFNEVGPAYFRTTGTPLLAGREFTRADAAGTAKVAIVNEEFAKRFGLGRQAVGKRIGMGGKELDIQIVGLARNAKYSEVKDAVPPLVFLPYRQDDEIGQLSFYVRSAADPTRVLAAIPKVVARADPNLPVEELKTLAAQARENVFMDRFIGVLSSAFAVLATLLAAVGLYGVVAYSVAQRTREIGLRMALGAGPAAVRGMVLRQVAWMTAIGGAIGLAAGIYLGQAARSLLYELQGYDPVVLAASLVGLAIVAVAAGYVPARRAAAIDPLSALRFE
jgi:predicted permease